MPSPLGETTLIGRRSMIGRRPLIVATIADPLLSNVAPIGPSMPTQARPSAIVLGIEMMFQFCRINATVSRPMSIARGTFQSPPCKSTTGAVSLAASVPTLHSDTHIGIGQHRRVVDPIPDDGDLIAFGLQTLDRLRFVSGKHFSQDIR